MKKLLILVGVICFLAPTTFAIPAQPANKSQHSVDQSIAALQQCLISKGFENIRFRFGNNNQILIEYENRRYRYELKAMGVMLDCIHEHLANFYTYIIAPKNRNVPIVYIEVAAKDFCDFKEGSISAEEFSQKLIIHQTFSSKIKHYFYKTELVNSSFFRFDLVLSPGLKVQFSRPQDPAQMQFNFAPSIESTLANGLYLKSQYLFPFYNEFQSKEATSRLESVYLNQFVRLPALQFLSISLGQFEMGYRGISGEFCKIFYDRKFAIATKLDLVSHTDDYSLHYLVRMKYYFTTVDFSIEACWGHFLYHDDTWRINLLRSFGELDMGFMGTWNHEIGLLTGLVLNVPFPGSQKGTPRDVRVVTPNTFSWRYRYLPYYDGYALQTGADIESYIQKLLPNFIRNNISALK